MEDLNPANSVPQKRKSLGVFPTMAQPGKLLLILAIVVTIFMFGAVALIIYAKTAPEDSFAVKLLDSIGISFSTDGDDASTSSAQGEEEPADTDEIDTEEMTEDEEESDTDEDETEDDDEEVTEVESDDAGRSFVYTYEDQLMYDDDVDDATSAVQIDTLSTPYAPVSGLFIPNTYPKFSPDGTKVLYTSGLQLKVYDLTTDTATVLYTATAPGFVGGDYYVSLNRACWKDEDEVFFASDLAVDDPGNMQMTYYVKLLNIDTLAISEWGLFDIDTGFGGMSNDPADWLLWHFSDLIGINYEMYFDGTNVYANTYQGGVVWVSIPNGGVGAVVPESTVLPFTDYEDLEMDMALNSTYESDPSHETYLLNNVGSAPIALSYFDSVLMKGGSTIYSDSAHGFWNLWDDEDNNQVYFTQIENSDSYQTCIDGELGNIENYYPSYSIMRYDTVADNYEMLVYGLSFDIH